MVISKVFLYFIFYSFIGWLYESIFLSIIKRRRFVNRGFLLGPYLPIYGTGAVVSWFLLKDIQNIYLVFILAALLCSLLEYVTSYIMEKLFKAKWWDYSDLPFNLHGRISLLTSTIFGFAVVVANFYIQPWLVLIIAGINKNTRNSLVFIMMPIFIVDTFITVGNWLSLNKKLGLIYNEVYEKVNESLTKASDQFLKTSLANAIEKGKQLSVKIKEVEVIFKPSHLRFFKAFSNLDIFKYNHLLKHLNLAERAKNFSKKKKDR